MLRATITLLALATFANAESSRLHGNPIRRVVTMLEEMAAGVEKEGAVEKELYEKFMCYCTKSDAGLAASMDAGTTKVSELESSVEEDTATKAQMDQDVTQHKADREAAEKSVKESTAMREKEAAEFAASSGELKANIQAMTGALEALKKGLSAALLQTSTGAMLKNIVQHTPLLMDAQREVMMSYLQQGADSSMEGGSDQIIGIVEQMKESMEANLKEASDGESGAKASYDTLMQAKSEEIQTATKGIETKMARSGELAVAVATNTADLEGSKESLAEDTTMKANLAKSCAQKTTEFDARAKIQAEEVQAISETIKILSEDDSLDTFKKALPSGGAFIQTSVRTKSQVRKFVDILNRLRASDSSHAADFKVMLFQTKAKNHMGNFEHIAKMIDDMIGLLGNEQKDDDKTKEFCDSTIRNDEGEKADTQGTIKAVSAKIAEISEAIETVDGEIATLQQGIADLDTGVAQATDMRKSEHADFSTVAAQNQAAIELLDMAKNRMNKFYNPQMYKTTTTPEPGLYGLVQESSQPAARSEQQDPLSAAFSFVQVRSHSRLHARDLQQDLSLGEYKKSGAAGGIIQMLDSMIGDVEAEMAEAKRDEADGQSEYEEMMADATAKRATDSELAVTKTSAKAELTSKLDDAKSDKGDANTLLSGLVTKIADLHSTCDFLLENYDFRKDARTKEIEGLHEGKAVLSGADLGFMQK